MKAPRAIAREILESQAQDTSYDIEPYVNVIEFAQGNGGGAEVELEEGDSTRQIKMRLQAAAKRVQGAGRLKWLRVKPKEGEDGENTVMLRFVFREPRAPRQPRAEGEAPRKRGRKPKNQNGNGTGEGEGEETLVEVTT